MQLSTAKNIIWGGILIYAVLLVFHQFYGMTASSYEHSFVKNITAPGALYSERWDRDFWFTGSLCLLWLVPLSAAFMLGSVYSKSRRDLHIFIIVLFWMYFTVILCLWSFDYAHANQGTLANAHNPANSKKWCCIYFNITGSGCGNLAACNPGVGPAELEVDGVFKWKFWFTLVHLILLMVDFFLMITWFNNEVNRKAAVRGRGARGFAAPLLEEDRPPAAQQPEDDLLPPSAPPKDLLARIRANQARAAKFYSK